MSLISSELKYHNILTELRVPLCGLTAKGATCISEVFMVKCSLQVLEMKANNIGDDGITAIAGALSNSQISKLYISVCDITLAGAQSLAAGLLVNNSVKILDVSGNPVTVKGACVILQSTVDKGVCQEVVIYDKVFSKLRGDEDYRNDDEVNWMMITLEKRKIQETSRQKETTKQESDEKYFTCSEDNDQLLQQENTQQDASSENDLVRQDETTGQNIQLNSGASRTHQCSIV
ncbi:ribonuclease inhibitor-like isoform X2 [Dysidea avara]|uniref:ribonuclease inhibitor-like isoform X2 n=1 Tax=Dysidea avara TaxID=196820 RepID=UPI00332BC779